jgi:hypothetical protein
LPNTTVGNDATVSVERGDVIGWSFRFTPLQKERTTDDDGKKIIVITKATLTEVSPVTFPAYESTTIEARSQSAIAGVAELCNEVRNVEIDDNTLAAVTDLRDYLTQTLDQSHSESRAAISPHRTAMAPTEQEWDADAAIARIKQWASSDGSGRKDAIDWSKYRQAFAWYDTENPQDFESYKLPHHDVNAQGELEVVWRGVVAAAAALAGARSEPDIPEQDISGVQAHLGTHYEQFDSTPPWEQDESRDQQRSSTPERDKRIQQLQEKRQELLQEIREEG